MIWRIEFEQAAYKDFKKLDTAAQRVILKYLRNRIATADDPRVFGSPLRKNLAGLWKYRIGKFRVIVDIQDETLCILVLRTGHRSTVYGGH